MSQMVTSELHWTQDGLRGLLGPNPVAWIWTLSVVTDGGVFRGEAEFRLPCGSFAVFRRGRG